MDWKRIMNRPKKGAPELEHEKKECELQNENEVQIDSNLQNENDLQNELQDENEFQKEIVQEYLNGLLPELNLRLFLELTDDEAIYINGGKISNVIKFPQMMLWAESITVTSYDDAVDTHRKKERIYNRLMGMGTKKSSLTLKKYKKERR